MNKLLFVVICCYCASLIVAYPAVIVNNTDTIVRQPFTFMDYLLRKFRTDIFNGTWITDSEFLYLTQRGDLYKYNAEIKKTNMLIPYFEMGSNGWEDFIASPDGKKILFKHDSEMIFRHSEVSRYDIYDIESDKAHRVHNGEKLQYCVWSPNSDSLAYVFENNVYYRNAKGDEIQLTDDGIPGIVYNGVPDWVYEEEVFSSGGTLWFSPDGKKVAFVHFNDTEVRTFGFVLYASPEDEHMQYPQELLLKYPKPGTPNPQVELRVIDLNELNKKWQVIPAPVDIISEDHILQSVDWGSENDLLALWYNRRQNIGSLQSCKYSGSCQEMQRFEQPNGWIPIKKIKCYPKVQSCLFVYWIGNWLQVWNLNLVTKKNTFNSFGNFTVNKIYDYNVDTGDVFYEGTLEGDSSQIHLYKNKECLSCELIDPENDTCKHATAKLSKKLSYYTVNCEGPNPAYSRLFNSKTNEEVTEWQKNERVRMLLKNKLQSKIKYLTVPIDGGFEAMVKLMLPPTLDENAVTPGKNYAMIVNVYSGPNSVRVNRKFSIGWDDYLVTSGNVIYATIDGRGTGQKGKDLLYSINNKLGKAEVEDQISVVKYLLKKYSFIDPERVGIWGWSYGGFVSSLTLAKDTDRLFQCGIAVAPVTSWLYYDSIYTERFMGLPTQKENLANYLAGDVSLQVENFKHHDFLLIHGSADDNVHYQQSMVLARALQKADIYFEQMTYTDEAHSLSSVHRHLYHTMEHFWTSCLNLDVENEENTME